MRAATVREVSAERAAGELLTAVPLIMRFLRFHMRRHRQTDLSVPQFRALVFVSQNDELSLSVLAEHVGLSLPAASRMVDLLVRRRLMQREIRPENRRCVSLSLTARGRATFRKALIAAQQEVARQFKALGVHQLLLICDAMQVLQGVFSPEQERGARGAGRVERNKGDGAKGQQRGTAVHSPKPRPSSLGPRQSGSVAP